MSEKKTLELVGVRPNSEQLKKGLPLFYQQVMTVRRYQEVLSHQSQPQKDRKEDKSDMEKAAGESDEPALARAAGREGEVEVAESAGIHGTELMRLGYTLSHVVHAYGSMCQSITELAMTENFSITSKEFHDLNRCLDIAIAGAVTEFQSTRNQQVRSREVERLGFLAHELRNALNSVSISHQLIKRGTVGPGGSTGRLLEKGLKRIEELIDRSLTEVRMRVDPKVERESHFLLQIVDQIIVTAEVEARAKNQSLDIQIDPTLTIEADEQLIHSALSNLIQNAIKYTRVGGRIQVRAQLAGDRTVVEVEDECGGLPTDTAKDLFKPFEQQNANRNGLGLGLTIAQRAVELHQGMIEVQDLPGKGCVFKVVLPKSVESVVPGLRTEQQSSPSGIRSLPLKNAP